MSEAHTHPGIDSVNTNLPSQKNPLQRKLDNYSGLDRKAKGYIAMWQYSGLSIYAKGLYQYLLCRQGGGSHCYPTVREIRSDLKITQARLYQTIGELQRAVPESVFRVVKGDGKGRNKYYLKKYCDWPESVCRDFWFPAKIVPVVPDSGTANVPDSGTNPLSSEPDSDTLLGIGNGVGSIGIGKEKIIDINTGENAIGVKSHFCRSCGMEGATYSPAHGVWVCSQHGQCHEEWLKSDDVPF